MTCHYCKAVDHVIEACPELIAKLKDRNATPTQNIKMITAMKRPVDSVVNVITRSGATIEPKNKGKELEGAWIHKALEKVPAFDV